MIAGWLEETKTGDFGCPSKLETGDLSNSRSKASAMAEAASSPAAFGARKGSCAAAVVAGNPAATRLSMIPAEGAAPLVLFNVVNILPFHENLPRRPCSPNQHYSQSPKNVLATIIDTPEWGVDGHADCSTPPPNFGTTSDYEHESLFDRIPGGHGFDLGA